MLDVFNLLLSLFTDLISFLDSFVLFGSVSILRIFIIIFIFKIGLKFLIKDKRGD